MPSAADAVFGDIGQHREIRPDMAVQDALALAGGAAGRHQAVRFVEGRCDRQWIGALTGDQCLVIQPIRSAATGDADTGVGGVEPVGEAVIGDDGRASVIVHVFRDLCRQQSRIQRRDDGANPRTGKDRLDHCMFVPEHRRDDIALADTETEHSPRQTCDALVQFAVGQPTVVQKIVDGDPVGMNFRAARHDMGNIGELPFGVFKRPVHLRRFAGRCHRQPRSAGSARVVSCPGGALSMASSIECSSTHPSGGRDGPAGAT